jgi:ABC-type branched-subunit amino acid transport system substrate-binding protein
MSLSSKFFRSCLVGTLVTGLTACNPGVELDLDGTLLGALLPYTGPSSGLGTNIEHSLLMVEDSVNASGGLLGDDMHVLAYDTHGKEIDAKTNARKLLGEPNLRGLVGPEEPGVAQDIAAEVKSKNILSLLPGDAAPRIPDPDKADLWFRTGPSANAVAGALVRKIREAGFKNIVILFEPDEYGAEVNRLLACQFRAAGGSEPSARALIGSLSSMVASLTFISYEAIVLIAYPETAARMVNEFYLSTGRTVRWYFPPTHDSPQFLGNVIPESLDLSTGVSPALVDEATGFTESYQKLWGDLPLTTSYYYYDSAALWALAVESAGREQGAAVTGKKVAEKLREVSAPPGETVKWSDLGRALELVRAGTDVDYQGLTGKLDIGASGIAAQNILRYWTAVNGKIAYEDSFDFSQIFESQCQ